LVSVQTLCLEIQLITSLNLSLDAKLLITFDLLCWLGYHFVFVYAKITKNADAQCAGVDIGGSLALSRLNSRSFYS